MKSIELQKVSKRYGDVLALDEIELSLEPGTIYGLLGRNGAGKTTLLNILSGRIFADQGEILIEEVPLSGSVDVSPHLFMVGEKNLYPDAMRVKDAFKWASQFFPNFDNEYCQRLTEEFKLTPKRKIKALSTGYRSIFKLVMALSVNTPTLLLDEPVLGLDANHRDLFYKLLLEKYAENPFTIVISTHLIEEVSSIIDHVVIIDEGRILVDKNRDTLLEKGFTVTGKVADVDLFTEGMEVIGSDSLGGLKSAYILGTIGDKHVPDQIEVSRLDLQKLFVELTNEREGA